MKLFAFAAFLVVVCDQLAKLWVRANFVVGGTQPIVPDWVRLTHSENSGAAWGLMAGQRWVLILVSVGVSVFVVMMARELARETPSRTSLSARTLPLMALGLIFGGAVGNLIDRVLFGVVTDFIDLDTPIEYLRTFPIFNLADSALTVGVILLMIHFVVNRESADNQQQTDNQQPTTVNHNASDSL